MINFTSLPKSVTAAIGALIVSSTFIAAAVGPAQAAGDAPVQTARVSVSAQAHA